MALSIVLSNDEGVPFTPGSLVLGVVKLVALSDQPIGSVAISFVGRSKVLLVHSYGDMTTSRSDYKSCGYLFCKNLNLYSGKYTHPKGTYVWPFVFRIPEFAHSNLDGYTDMGDTFDHRPPWRGSDNFDHHPLPPSMDHTGAFNCSVEYLLHATLIRPPKPYIAFSNNVGVSKFIQVDCPPERIDPEAGNEWPYETYHRNFHIRCTDPSTSMKNRVVLMIRRSAQGSMEAAPRPKLGIQLCVLVPKIVGTRPDTTIPILLSVTCLSKTGAKKDGCLAEVPFPSPTIRIKRFTISISTHTRVRAGCHFPVEKRKVFLGKGACEIPLTGDTSGGEVSNEPTPFPTNSVNLGDIANVRFPHGRLVPDFSTYNIFRAYCLDLRFKVGYAHKTFNFAIRDIPVRVVSAGILASDFDTTTLHDSAVISQPPNIDDIDDIFGPPPCYRP
jgi:Arrestin (or S-antigen), N-terminal domain